MKEYLQVNIASKTVEYAGGGEWEPATQVFGETMVLAIRFNRNVDGTAVEHAEDIRQAYLSLGWIDERPAGGKWAVQVGSGPQTAGNTCAQIPAAATPEQLRAALAAVTSAVNTYGTPVVRYEDGSYIVVWGTGLVQVPMRVVANNLTPLSHGRVNAWQTDGVWEHEIRLTQTLAAFSTGVDRVLPPEPTVTRLRAGATESGVQLNEIQELYVPQEFRGAFVLKRGYERTALLTRSSSAETIQAELKKLNAGFTVEQGENYKVTITFGGDMAGTGQDLLVPEVETTPEGDLTLNLPLDGLALWKMLRVSPEVTLPLQLDLNVADEAGTVQRKTAFRVPITVARSLYFNDLDQVLDIDWTRPPSPKDYIPQDPSTVITGQQHYSVTFGDGALTTFAVAHPLATDDIAAAVVRENTSNGKMMVLGTDYDLVINSASEVTVNWLGTTPTADQYILTLTTAGPVSAFVNGLRINIDQVNGLQDVLDGLDERVAGLEDRFPPEVAVTVPTTGAILTINFDPATYIFNANETVLAGGVAGLAALRNRPLLLPAVHDASTTTLPDPLPSPASDTVWVSDRTVLVPVGGGIRASTVKSGEFVGSDGLVLYPVMQRGETISYFPKAFEKQLWEISINDKMLTAGRSLVVRFDLAFQLINADSEAQWMVVIEKGVATDKTVGSPDTTATDLLAVTWDEATPLLRQRVIVTPNLTQHSFGCTVTRTQTTISAQRWIYGAAEVADAPASANFVLRARLDSFDTKDSVAGARGWPVVKMVAPGSGTLGAVIS